MKVEVFTLSWDTNTYSTGVNVFATEEERNAELISWIKDYDPDGELPEEPTFDEATEWHSEQVIDSHFDWDSHILDVPVTMTRAQLQEGLLKGEVTIKDE